MLKFITKKDYIMLDNEWFQSLSYLRTSVLLYLTGLQKEYNTASGNNVLKFDSSNVL